MQARIGAGPSHQVLPRAGVLWLPLLERALCLPQPCRYFSEQNEKPHSADGTPRNFWLLYA